MPIAEPIRTSQPGYVGSLQPAFIELPPELRNEVYTYVVSLVRINLETFVVRQSRSGRYGYVLMHPLEAETFQESYNTLFRTSESGRKRGRIKPDCSLILVCKHVSREFISFVLKSCVFLLGAGPAAMLWNGYLNSHAISGTNQPAHTYNTVSPIESPYVGHRLLNFLGQIRRMDLAFDYWTWPYAAWREQDIEVEIITDALRLFSCVTQAVVRVYRGSPQWSAGKVPPSYPLTIADAVKYAGPSLQTFHLSFRWIQRGEWLDVPLAYALRVGTDPCTSQTQRKVGQDWILQDVNNLWQVETACEHCVSTHSHEFEYCDHSKLLYESC